MITTLSQTRCSAPPNPHASAPRSAAHLHVSGQGIHLGTAPSPSRWHWTGPQFRKRPHVCSWIVDRGWQQCTQMHTSSAFQVHHSTAVDSSALTLWAARLRRELLEDQYGTKNLPPSRKFEICDELAMPPPLPRGLSILHLAKTLHLVALVQPCT